jgi:hypothetical protein
MNRTLFCAKNMVILWQTQCKTLGILPTRLWVKIHQQLFVGKKSQIITKLPTDFQLDFLTHSTLLFSWFSRFSTVPTAITIYNIEERII